MIIQFGKTGIFYAYLGQPFVIALVACHPLGLKGDLEGSFHFIVLVIEIVEVELIHGAGEVPFKYGNVLTSIGVFPVLPLRGCQFGAYLDHGVAQ